MNKKERIIITAAALSCSLLLAGCRQSGESVGMFSMAAAILIGALAVLSVLLYRSLKKNKDLSNEIIRENKSLSQYVMLTGDYDFTAIINSGSHSLTVLRITDKYDSLKRHMYGENIALSDYLHFMNQSVYQDDLKTYHELSAQDIVEQNLSSCGVYKFEVRLLIGDTPEYYEIKYSRGEDGTDIIGHVNCDAVAKSILNYGKTAGQEYSNAYIAALGADYESVDYVEILPNKFDDYVKDHHIISSNLGTLVPGWRQEEKLSSRLGLLINSVVHPDDREEFYRNTRREQIMKSVVEGKPHVVNFRTLENGNINFYQERFTPIYDEDGSVRHMVVGIRNIDEETKRELIYKGELAKEKDRAIAASRAKSTFLINMSRDLRTPLNAIRGYVEMAKKDREDPERVVYCLDKTLESEKELEVLVNDILDMSRRESGNTVISPARTDISNIFHDIKPELMKQAQDKNIYLNFNLISIRDKTVMCDIQHVQQIIMNLVTNAIKYTQYNGQVDVSLRQTGRKGTNAIYCLKVIDNGYGMSSSFLEHAFDLFSREDNTVVKNIRGTGLGLPMCKNLTELMQGTIKLESEKGLGTVVTVEIPFEVCGSEPSYENVLEEKLEQVELNGRHVLLCEDNEMNREIARTFLMDRGMTVDEAEDGRIALEKVKQHDPDFYDFILMDIQMPYMNGYEATKAIRNVMREKRIPIIALSANAFAEDRERSLSAGLDDHVAKPLDVNTLEHAIRKVLAGKDDK